MVPAEGAMANISADFIFILTSPAEDAVATFFTSDNAATTFHFLRRHDAIAFQFITLLHSISSARNPTTWALSVHLLALAYNDNNND